MRPQVQFDYFPVRGYPLERPVADRDQRVLWRGSFPLTPRAAPAY